MTRLLLWDVDRTLLIGGGVGLDAFAAAFTAVTGRPWVGRLIAAGRTDLSITPELFAQHGIPDATPYLDAFFARYADEFAARGDAIAERGRVLPGVPEVLAALHEHPGVVQTLVTGNIAAVGFSKVAAFGLEGFLDTGIGGYGDDHAVRSELVVRARERAEAVHGPFADEDVLVIGDTVLDVGAALAAGVVAVGVATGETTTQELLDAGAHHALEDLSDVPAVVALLSKTPAS